MLDVDLASFMGGFIVGIAVLLIVMASIVIRDSW